jgi:hypothetical protein
MYFKVETFDDWTTFFKSSGYKNLLISKYDMNFRGMGNMLQDEGLINGFKVMCKYITNKKIRKRMQKLNGFFKNYPEYVGYGIFIGTN